MLLYVNHAKIKPNKTMRFVRDVDLLDEIVDPNTERQRRYEEALDALSIEERDIVSIKIGILEHSGKCPCSIRELAQLKQKPLTTMWRILKKAVKKLRENYRH